MLNSSPYQRHTYGLSSGSCRDGCILHFTLSLDFTFAAFLLTSSSARALPPKFSIDPFPARRVSSLRSSSSSSHNSRSTNRYNARPTSLHSPPRRNRMVAQRTPYRSLRHSTHGKRREACKSHWQSARRRRQINRTKQPSPHVRPNPLLQTPQIQPKKPQNSQPLTPTHTATSPPARAPNAPSNS